jgi:hypothetical protein
MRPERVAQAEAEREAPAWGSHRLAAVEAEFFSLRTRPADLPAAFRAAIESAAGIPAPPDLRAAGEALAEAVTRQPSTLAYHNPHHFAETVLVMGWLCAIGRREGRLDARQAGLGVIAMVGHDFGHDGSPPGGGRLEALAAEASLAALAAHKLPPADQDILRAVILGTDPDRVRDNAARAAGRLPPGPLGAAVDLLAALANEADVFASFLPDLGPRQSGLLALEWRAGGHAEAAGVLGFANRLAFLRLYESLTPMARELGVAELRARQFAAFTCGGGLLEIGGTPDEGAAALDALPLEDARRRFTACLREMKPGGA